MFYRFVHPSPVGNLTLIADEKSLHGIRFDCEPDSAPECLKVSNEIIEKAIKWLDEYFSGREPNFTVPVKFVGTHFRVAVWEEIARIPYGKTTTYGAIARTVANKLGKPGMSAQAVGGAVGKNPVPIVVPCHRVIGANGTLTGFSAGLDKKKILLDVEKIAYKD